MTNHEVSDRAAFPLAMAQEGDRVSVLMLHGGKGMEMRLTTLGLHVGSELTVMQRQGGNLVVISGETRFALGAGMAQKIMVTQL
ncbi:MAG: FeoA family protein [Chromatiales bacterium]|jgi:ferrous iron transport protein A